VECVYMDKVQFRKNYESKSTDELLYLYSRGGLVEAAKIVLEDVIHQRGVDDFDIKHSEVVVKQEKEYIESRKNKFENHFKRKLIFWGILALGFIIYKFYNYIVSL